MSMNGAVEYACGRSALVIQPPFVAAQLDEVYNGTQRKRKPALIALKEFQDADSEIGVWRWLYATKKLRPEKNQKTLLDILASLELLLGPSGTKSLWEKAEEIRGTICGLAKISIGSTAILETKGIAIAPDATFYLFEEIYRVPNPVKVGAFHRTEGGKVKFPDRHLTFGVHVELSVLERVKAQFRG
jgi:hypothetical protein